MARYSVYRPWAGDGWRSFDELRREMDRLLGQFRSDAPGVRTGVFPATNLYDSGDAYVLTAELPGVRPEDIEISLQDKTLTLRGERKVDQEDGQTSAHRRERRGGAFRRAFELPAPVEPDKVEAIHKNGVLVLRMPKTPESQPRQIAIRAR